jgi:hypothetical protein
LFASAMHAFQYSWRFLLRYRVAISLLIYKLRLAVKSEAYYLRLGRQPVRIFR